MSLKVAVIGAGARGQNAYGQYCLDYPNEMKYVAAIDPDESQLAKIKMNHNIDEGMLFTEEDDFYGKGKLCDAVVIANMDRDHYYSIVKCLDLGYDILLEKPITPSREELKQIELKVKETGCKVMVCYVLRYTPFFKKLKDIVDSEKLETLLVLIILSILETTTWLTLLFVVTGEIVMRVVQLYYRKHLMI